MRRTNQGGLILSFLVVGGVMALLLIGGVYVVRHVLAPDASVSGSVTQNDKDSKTPAASSNSQQKPVSSDSSQSDQDKNSAAKTDENSDAAVTDQTEDASAAADSLPTTGPADVLLETIMIGTLAAVVLAYARSRRPLATL